MPLSLAPPREVRDTEKAHERSREAPPTTARLELVLSNTALADKAGNNWNEARSLGMCVAGVFFDGTKPPRGE